MDALPQLRQALVCASVVVVPPFAHTHMVATPMSFSFSDQPSALRDLCDCLLLDEVTSDISLKVQEAILPAHRAILGARSPIFKAMFFGPMKETCAKEVEISAFPASSMKHLLRFLYSGDVGNVPVGDLVPLMACADYYGVSALRDSISAHLDEVTTKDNVCAVLAAARTYHQKKLEQTCFSFFLVHAHQAVRAAGFCQLDAVVVQTLLDADDAQTEEVELFKALVLWQRHQSTLPTESRPDEKQTGKLFDSIRYTQMTPKELVEEVRPLAGKVVRKDTYMRALEQVAAPGAEFEDGGQAHRKQTVRRPPPIVSIRVSDLTRLSVNNTCVEKLGPSGFDCSVLVEPSTPVTRFHVQKLGEPGIGFGIGIVEITKSMKFDSVTCFPKATTWETSCKIGFLGNGKFFGIQTSHVVQYTVGLVIEVAIDAVRGGLLHVRFSCFSGNGEDHERTGDACERGIQVAGSMCATVGVWLALALHSTGDRVSVESAW